MPLKECPLCNLDIYEFEPGEYGRLPIEEQLEFDARQAEHQEACKRKVAAFREMEYWPRGPAQVRQLEAEALDDMASPEMRTKTRGMWRLCQMYFDRSLDLAAELGYWRQHPRDWMEFAKYLDCELFLRDEDLLEYCRREMAPSPGPLIGPDMYWYPQDE